MIRCMKLNRPAGDITADLSYGSHFIYQIIFISSSTLSRADILLATGRLRLHVLYFNTYGFPTSPVPVSILISDFRYTTGRPPRDIIA